MTFTGFDGNGAWDLLNVSVSFEGIIGQVWGYRDGWRKSCGMLQLLEKNIKNVLFKCSGFNQYFCWGKKQLPSVICPAKCDQEQKSFPLINAKFLYLMTSRWILKKKKRLYLRYFSDELKMRLHCPKNILAADSIKKEQLFLPCLVPAVHSILTGILQSAILDLWIMIYHLIKSTVPPFSLSESWGEKMKCELVLRHFPLMHIPLFSPFSNPALGSIESPVSILSLSLIKHIHSMASYPPPPSRLLGLAKKALQPPGSQDVSCTGTKSHAKISVNKASSQDTQKSVLLEREKYLKDFWVRWKQLG